MLEDQIRRVNTSYSEEECAVNDLQSRVLISIGRKSKQFQFTAQGSAGGGPVMMGVGHVKDALDEKQTIDLEADKEKKKGKPSAIGKPKPKY